MLTFKTQFPINNDKEIADVIEAGRIWIAGSPHSEIAEKLKIAHDIQDEWSAKAGNESIVFHLHENGEKLGAFRYENIGNL